jgi:PKHD-type hydroxylase
MKGEWCYFKSYFTKQECEKIISDALKLPSQDAVVGVNGISTALDTRIRKSKVRFISDKDPTFTWLFDRIWKTAIEANRDFFNIHITKLEFLQFAEYDASYEGEYKEHHDVFWLNNDPVFHRKLSGIVQLSDPSQYGGGQFEITETVNAIDKDIEAQGTVVYFPSMLRHKANKVTSGTRYSLAAWFEGPKWR